MPFWSRSGISQKVEYNMEFKETKLPGVKLLKPKRFGDHRGFFAETYSRRVYTGLGVDVEFVQDNHSLSAATGTVRGLHFQAPPHAQAKLVRCGRGAIFDVAVDIRRGSPTYGHWVGYELSAANGAQIFIPAGFAHGFTTLEPDSEIIYKCNDYYAPETEGALHWDDLAIGIDWPVTGDAILSDKDAVAPLLADLDSPFEFKG
jgi:dTDP-4-dehydrorhamnose 3,5-epimerase